ncbi:MAG: Gfo/Idh/MocA family protein [Acidimicrobiales bacterium]
MTTQANDSNNLRVGVVGCGYWGSKHVRVLSSLANVEVSLIDRDEGKRAALEPSFPIRRSVAELDEVIDDVDALVIATPPTTHYPIARQALLAGIHCMVEKPFTTTVHHGQELIDIATAKDLRLMVGHTFEFNAAVWSLKEATQDPSFGQVRYINSARLNLGLYQPDVDVLWDLAPHDISIINYVLSSSPTEVSAWGLKLMGERPDVAYLNMRYDEIDVSASIHVSWLDPMKVRRTTVVGENAMAVYDDMNADERIRLYDKGVKAEGGVTGDGPEIPLTYRHGDIHSPFVDFKEPLGLELSGFVDAIRTSSRPPVDGYSGLDVVSVLCAAEESQRQNGAWVPTRPSLAELTGPSTNGGNGKNGHRNGSDSPFQNA